MADARARRLPLVVDAWAPWCHTCASLREYVLKEPAVRALGDRFVWLAIDTERPENAPFLAKFPMENWPTLWVVDPESEAPVLKWIGTATGAELVELLEDAESALRAGSAGADATAAFVRALPGEPVIFCDEATLEIPTGLSWRRFDRHWVDDPHTWDLIDEAARRSSPVYVATWKRKLAGHEGPGDEIVFAAGADPHSPGPSGFAVMRVER